MSDRLRAGSPVGLRQVFSVGGGGVALEKTH